MSNKPGERIVRRAEHTGGIKSRTSEHIGLVLHMHSPVTGTPLCEWATGVLCPEDGVAIADQDQDPRVVAAHVDACQACVEVRFS